MKQAFKIIFLFTICATSIASAQEYSVEYHVNFLTNEGLNRLDSISNSSKQSDSEFQRNSFTYDLFNGLVNDVHDLKFKLYTNSDHSYFEANEKTDASLDPQRDMGMKTVTFGTYYSELSEQGSFYKSRRPYMVFKKNIKWNLLNETKQIGKYTCYKATGIKTVVNSKGTFYREVIAWYTPDIPLPFGPLEFSGLPGIIIALTEEQPYFTLEIKAVRINANVKHNKNIKRDKSILVLTEKEYLKKQISEDSKKRNSNGF